MHFLASVNYLSLSLHRLFQIFIILLKPPITTHFPQLILSTLSRNLGQSYFPPHGFTTFLQFQWLWCPSDHPRSNTLSGHPHSLQQLTSRIKISLTHFKCLPLCCVLITDTLQFLYKLIVTCSHRFHFFPSYSFPKSLLSFCLLASLSTLQLKVSSPRTSIITS